MKIIWFNMHHGIGTYSMLHYTEKALHSSAQRKGTLLLFLLTKKAGVHHPADGNDEAHEQHDIQNSYRDPFVWITLCIVIRHGLVREGNKEPINQQISTLNYGWQFSMMASSEVTDDGFVRVVSLSDLSKQQKICVKVQDRIIALFFAKGSVYALDLFCYRKEEFVLLYVYNYSWLVDICASLHTYKPCQIWGV